MSKPVYLVQFAYGTSGTVAARRAAASRDVIAGGFTWTASSIDFDDIELSGDTERDTVKFTLPLSDDWAYGYFKDIPEERLIVTVYRYDRSDDSLEFTWQGTLTDPEVTGGIITMPCDPSTTALGSTTLPRVFMRACPHGLYSGGCRLNKSDFAISATVTAVSGTTVTIEASSDITSGLLTGGIIELPDGSTRNIKYHATTTFKLAYKMPRLATLLEGSDHTVTVYPGCGQSVESCSAFPNSDNASGTNIENYGGFPWAITGTQSPFGGGSIT